MKRILIRSFATVVLAAAVALAVWLLVALKFVYSKGDRAGYVQKFSNRGWLIKTWEGELAMVNLPGALSEKFEFTVRDPKVAEEIRSYTGSRVVLGYEQHRFLPSHVLGDTEYWVVSVKKQEE